MQRCSQSHEEAFRAEGQGAVGKKYDSVGPSSAKRQPQAIFDEDEPSDFGDFGLATFRISGWLQPRSAPPLGLQ